MLGNSYLVLSKAVGCASRRGSSARRSRSLNMLRHPVVQGSGPYPSCLQAGACSSCRQRVDLTSADPAILVWECVGVAGSLSHL